MRTSRLILATAVSFFGFPAYAASLDGVWAHKEAPSCKDAPLTDGWPLRINGNRWTGYEMDCTADRVGEGAVKLSCAIEGDGEWTQNMNVTLSGDTLTIVEDGKTLVSADGLRQYRPPSMKPNLGIKQANFEQRLIPQGQWQSNGHLDIIGP